MNRWRRLTEDQSKDIMNPLARSPQWGIFVITGFRLQLPAGGAPSRSQQMRFVVPVNNTKIGYELILI